jgi:proline racemase
VSVGLRSDVESLDVETVDYHTAGEPFRIVVSGAPELPGSSVADRRRMAIESVAAQRVRRLLCHEPRGHADMYGCFLVPPDDDGAHLGTLFWHRDGFSTACGHGTIALATWAVQTGVVAGDPDGATDVRIDVPSGRVGATVRQVGGVVRDVVFRNVPGYVLHREVSVPTSLGDVVLDVSFAGAIYASLPAARVGLAVEPDLLGRLTEVGREIKWAVQNAGLAEHPDDPRLSGCYGTILYDDLGDGPQGPHQRNVTVFADGEVDRSPCGSGTSARVVLLAADGRLGGGRVLIHDSVIGTRFIAHVAEQVTAADRPAVITAVTGSAFRTGAHRFVLDGEDPLADGFLLR